MPTTLLMTVAGWKVVVGTGKRMDVAHPTKMPTGRRSKTAQLQSQYGDDLRTPFAQKSGAECTINRRRPLCAGTRRSIYPANKPQAARFQTLWQTIASTSSSMRLLSAVCRVVKPAWTRGTPFSQHSRGSSAKGVSVKSCPPSLPVTSVTGYGADFPKGSKSG